jgi:hypothetical protein
MYEFTPNIASLECLPFIQDGSNHTNDNRSTKSRASSIFSTLGSIFQQSRTNSLVKQNQALSPGQSMWTFARNFFVKRPDPVEEGNINTNTFAIDVENGERISLEADNSPFPGANTSELLPASNGQTPQRPHQGQQLRMCKGDCGRSGGRRRRAGFSDWQGIQSEFIAQ